MSPHNRRAHARHAIRLAAEVRGAERTFTATTRDISEGGCCVEAAYPLADGATVGLALFVVVDGIEDTHAPPLEVRAHVQWAADNPDAPVSARHVTGLRFEAISPAQVQWLRSVLARATPGE